MSQNTTCLYPQTLMTGINKSREFIRGLFRLHSLVYNLVDIYFFLLTDIRNQHEIQQNIQDESSSSMNVVVEHTGDLEYNIVLSSNVNNQYQKIT